MITKRLDRDLDTRVRRADFKDFDTLLSHAESLLQDLQSHNPHHQERLEFLFRRALSTRLPSLLHAVHTHHFKTPSSAAQALLEA